MLTTLTLENFKPFGTSQTIPFAPLTLIYGPNSGGKSSILQSLLLLRQSFGTQFLPDYPLLPRGESVDLGSYKALLHKHDLNRTLTIAISFDNRGRILGPRTFPRFPLLSEVSTRRVSCEFSVSPRERISKSDRPELSSLQYYLSIDPTKDQETQEPLDVRLKKATDTTAILQRMPHDRDVSCYNWTDPESVKSYASFLLRRPEIRTEFEELWLQGPLMRALERITGSTLRGTRAKPSLAKVCEALELFAIIGRGTLPKFLCPMAEASTASLRDRTPISIAPGIEQFEIEVTSLLQSIRYLGPLRSYPERHYLLGGAHTEGVGKTGENTPQVLYYKSHSITKALNAWFATFGLPYEVDPQKIGDEVVGEMIVVRLTDKRTQTEVTPSDVGFGLGQLLPVLVQGLVSEGQVMCVEQPEIHLHPKLQGTLGDFLLWASNIYSEDPGLPERPATRNQWVVETHSEALILRILKRIRQGSVKAGDVSVLYVNPIEGMGAEILPLRIDKTGKFIDEWPEGFFEETFNEMFT